MALLTEELAITSIEEILSKALTLPTYQRPYRWSLQATNTLFIDTYHAYEENAAEYRLGTVILHKDEGAERYNIVDGQQRLTTLAILLYALGDREQPLLQEKYSELSNNAIVHNHRALYQRVNELPRETQQAYRDYVLQSCKMVQIITDDEQEAFQFFDSQNTRGKALAPHDILKSYHLREMNQASDELKLSVIRKWEHIDTAVLTGLFANYLYPVIQWYRMRDGLNYSTKEIDTFKGIRSGNVANFALYHKASQLYVEQFNEAGNHELLAATHLNQFQLTQPLLAGKRFFYYTFHYHDLLEAVRDKMERFHRSHDHTLPDGGSGDRYIKIMYESALLFFADRFGIESLSDAVFKQLFTWCYALRITMYAVYQETINKYVTGTHHRLNYGVDMFARISEMQGPEELKLIILAEPTAYGARASYQASHDLICDWNGWSKK